MHVAYVYMYVYLIYAYGSGSNPKVCSRAGAHTRDIPRYKGYVTGRRLSSPTLPLLFFVILCNKPRISYLCKRGLLARVFGHRVSTHYHMCAHLLQCIHLYTRVYIYICARYL